MNVSMFHTKNDRIIHRWQTYAGCYSEKTVVWHLAAIRYFESFLDGKVFSKLTTEDFAAVREDLKRRANADASDSLSASSIRHTVSHIGAFFDWLLKQDGYRRLPNDFAGYLTLPKAVVARAAQVRQKAFPSLKEAKELLAAMPAQSLVDQRARALFALAFLGALRADTLISLRIKHIDVERRLILQDARMVRAKAGKNLTVFWFQIPVAFENVVCEWIETLKRFGFMGDDALFPEARHLKHRFVISGRITTAVPVMTTTHAVTAAFSAACSLSEIKYTPHSAKHAIGAERDILSLTHEERKAWSLNMGHDSELTTELCLIIAA
jgi:integrase